MEKEMKSTIKSGLDDLLKGKNDPKEKKDFSLVFSFNSSWAKKGLSNKNPLLFGEPDEDSDDEELTQTSSNGRIYSYGWDFGTTFNQSLNTPKKRSQDKKSLVQKARLQIQLTLSKASHYSSSWGPQSKARAKVTCRQLLSVQKKGKKKTRDSFSMILDGPMVEVDVEYLGDQDQLIFQVVVDGEGEGDKKYGGTMYYYLNGEKDHKIDCLIFGTIAAERARDEYFQKHPGQSGRSAPIAELIMDIHSESIKSDITNDDILAIFKQDQVQDEKYATKFVGVLEEYIPVETWELFDLDRKILFNVDNKEVKRKMVNGIRYIHCSPTAQLSLEDIYRAMEKVLDVYIPNYRVKSRIFMTEFHTGDINYYPCYLTFKDRPETRCDFRDIDIHTNDALHANIFYIHIDKLPIKYPKTYYDNLRHLLPSFLIQCLPETDSLQLREDWETAVELIRQTIDLLKWGKTLSMTEYEKNGAHATKKTFKEKLKQCVYLLDQSAQIEKSDFSNEFLQKIHYYRSVILSTLSNCQSFRV